MPRTRRGRILLAAAIVLLIAGIAAWTLRKPAAPPLATSPVTRGDLEQTVDATGVIDAYKLVSVGAQASGQIKSLRVQLGDVVKEGDLIAEIDSTTQQNSLQNAEAALENIRAQRAVQQATLREAELAFQRQKQMLAEEATSRAEYEGAEAKLATSQAQVRALDAQIKQRETELGTARANLGYTRITAPIDGTVVAVVAEEGRTVNANQSAPTIVKLARLDLVTVNAEISEADVVKVKPGMPVYFTILGQPDRKYHATLRTVNPAPSSIASESTTSTSSSSSSTAVYYNALFDVENPDGTLRIDMTAQVSVLLSQAKDALLIPAVALGAKIPARGERPAGQSRGAGAGQAGGDGSRPARTRPASDDGASTAAATAEESGDWYMVRVVGKDGQPEPRRIRTGLNNGSSVEVLEGLAESDRVVVGEVTAAERAAAAARGNRSPMAPMMGGPRR
ncbi:efflux RND transporter periplasmic adaptor subunit [Flavobacterium sp. MXW15]|uniref:Efflux RND transporter periplasmic adaptor subunit n=1 Tax=Xanthomonas chitinilytica TaxID=2989819 RepID=A0ABT3JR90_9XANT|nr:efflux RND transporter periplasmic adaptor subunit [Xanthomonas sp. H13-6]MCW4453283.1 efflux RND transporter periplasmic adaptor subunit [Flavobacterium sp. MXW15]MCW4470996.1 efflux RND transporter periplasmic adaptor subunit [Xanthomonas sp. H13-6]